MKILIVTKNWLGDILFELPAIEEIRKRYPDAEILCMAPPRCREILELHPAVSRVLEFDERGGQRSFWARLRFVLRLRREKIDQAWLFHGSRTRAFLLWLGGVKQRTGFSKKSGAFLTKSFPEPAMPLHQVDYFTALLSAAGFEIPPSPSYKFYFSKEDENRALRILHQHGVERPYICFHLGANWEPKRWPPAHFARLADLLSAEGNFQFVVTGSRGDSPLAKQMLSALQKARAIDLTGRTGLGEVAAIFKRSLFVVSGDSGPMHIASGAGARVITLFGPTDPALTGPRGVGESLVLSHVPEGYSVPWYGEKFPEGGWLAGISPERVLSAVREKNWLKPREVSGAALLPEVKKSGKHLLVVTLSNIGDVILTTPVMTSLLREFPGASLTVVCGPKAAPLLTGSRLIDKLVIYDKKSSWKTKLQMVMGLRAHEYEAVVDLRNTLIPFLVRARKRSPLFRKFSQVNMRQRHLEVLKQSGLPVYDGNPFDFFSDTDLQRALNRLKYKGVPSENGWILVSPVAASSAKTWPLEKFQETVKELLSMSSSDILIVGDSSSVEAGRIMAAAGQGRVFNLAGETSLRELAALISRSRLVLANDSAVMHLGFELEKPVAAVFGPTDHEKYGHAGPCFRLVRGQVSAQDAKAGNYFGNLETSKVAAACRELLGLEVSQRETAHGRT